MVRAARIAYLVLSWAFVAGLLVQVFLIVMGIFGEPGVRDLHVGLDWVLYLVPLVILAAAYFARTGSRHWQWALAERPRRREGMAPAVRFELTTKRLTAARSDG